MDRNSFHGSHCLGNTNWRLDGRLNRRARAFTVRAQLVEKPAAACARRSFITVSAAVISGFTGRVRRRRPPDPAAGTFNHPPPPPPPPPAGPGHVCDDGRAVLPIEVTTQPKVTSDPSLIPGKQPIYPVSRLLDRSAGSFPRGVDTVGL